MRAESGTVGRDPRCHLHVRGVAGTALARSLRALDVVRIAQEGDLTLIEGRLVRGSSVGSLVMELAGLGLEVVDIRTEEG